MYIRKIIKMSNGTTEVEEYYSNRIGIHDRRAKKEKPTEEQMRKSYARRKMKTLRWLMNENFRDGVDAMVTLTFHRGEAPDTLEGVKHAAALFLRKLREEYKNLGLELKYIYVVEIGSRGARHVHMMISHAGELPLMVIQRYWNGIVHVVPLHTQGQYEDAANYFLKQYAEKTERATGEDIKRCFECSRNLRKPEIIIERIREKDIRKDIEPPEGMTLDRSSVREGVGARTGRPYRFYRLLTAEKKPDVQRSVSVEAYPNTLFEKVKRRFGDLIRRLRR